MDGSAFGYLGPLGVCTSVVANYEFHMMESTLLSLLMCRDCTLNWISKLVAFFKDANIYDFHPYFSIIGDFMFDQRIVEAVGLRVY